MREDIILPGGAEREEELRKKFPKFHHSFQLLTAETRCLRREKAAQDNRVRKAEKIAREAEEKETALKAENQELRKERDRLVRDNKSLAAQVADLQHYACMEGNNVSLTKENSSLRKEKELLSAQMEKERKLQEKNVNDLKGKITQLEGRLNKDFENSSIPSSQKPAHKKICNNRVRSGLKPGAQKGHKGNRRRCPEGATKTVVLSPDKGKLGGGDWYETKETVEKTVYDIVVGVTVTRYVARVWRNRKTTGRYHAPFPEGVVNEMSIGPGIKTLAYLMNNKCNVPVEKVREMLSDMSGGRIHISAGTICNLTQEFSRKAADEVKAIREAIVGSATMYTDFTVGRVNGKGKAVNICTNGEDALYTFKDHKGMSGVAGTPAEHFTGTLVHDHDRTFYNFGKAHQECLAHIIRYLTEVLELEPGLSWAKSMRMLIREMIHTAKASGRNLSKEQVDDFFRRYDEILATARKEYKENPPSKYVRDGIRLSTRLADYKEDTLYFLTHPDVDTTNDISERLLRGYKRKQMSAVTFRSEENPKALCDGLSVIATAGMKEQDVYGLTYKIFSRPGHYKKKKKKTPLAEATQPLQPDGASTPGDGASAPLNSQRPQIRT